MGINHVNIIFIVNVAVMAMSIAVVVVKVVPFQIVDTMTNQLKHYNQKEGHHPHNVSWTKLSPMKTDSAGKSQCCYIVIVIMAMQQKQGYM